MKRLALLLLVFIAGTAPLTAQGPSRAGLWEPPVAVSAIRTPSPVARASSGMTRSERGALIGAVVGVVAGVILSAHYDEKSFSAMLTAGIVMAIPVSLIGAIIGSM